VVRRGYGSFSASCVMRRCNVIAAGPRTLPNSVRNPATALFPLMDLRGRHAGSFPTGFGEAILAEFSELRTLKTTLRVVRNLILFSFVYFYL